MAYGFDGILFFPACVSVIGLLIPNRGLLIVGLQVVDDVGGLLAWGYYGGCIAGVGIVGG